METETPRKLSGPKPLTETATGKDNGCAEDDCFAGMFLPKRAHHVQPLQQRLAIGWDEDHWKKGTPRLTPRQCKNGNFP